ncbi:carbohydrate-binding family 9-like protein [Flagellimonas sp. S3867]|uniref:carbohydrate-binding family 9-like protein n=1 Tax=Flagellimonas sp. S3867 TaxID=2768063 RepID=UPI0016874E03|nr:carbohydrate-binding family 9-like protein [Flagellimonas sp. S3867]
MKYIVLLTIALVSSVYFFDGKMKNNMKAYTVLKAQFDEGENVRPLSDDLWNQSIVMTDFSQPWRHEPMQETSFRALHTDKYLYLRYDVKDNDLIIFDNYQNKRDIIRSDRVEIFLRKDADLDRYYCLEVDPNGAILDFSATHYRQFDDDWTWPKGHLFTYGTIMEGGYRLDMILSKESLENLGLVKENVLEAGIFRADTDMVSDAENPDGDFKWITWVDPKTKEPDFHVPTSFGQLLLSE